MIKVLIADDEEKVAQLVYNLINWAALDMDVTGMAHNGIEALALIEEKQPDIVITDIRMPGCDGLELISRAKEINPELEFIIISGYRHFDYAQSAIRYGVSDYLLKPVNKAELTATLDKMRWSYKQRTRNLSHQEQQRLRTENDQQRLRATIFAAIAKNALLPQASLEAINQEYHFHFAPGLYEAALLKLDGDFDTIHAGGIAAYASKLVTYAEKILQEVCLEFQVGVAGTTGQIVLNYAPGKEAEVRKGLRALLEKIMVDNSVFSGAAFTLARGGSVQHPAQLGQSLACARLRLASRLTQGGHRLIEQDGPPPQPEQRAEIQQRVCRGLEAALEVHSVQAVEEVLNSLGSLVAAAPLAGEDILALCNELCMAYLLLAQNRNIRLPGKDIVYDEFCARLDLCGSLPQALDCLRHTILTTFKAALQSQSEAEAKPIRMSKQYIAGHYASPISLEEVAAQAGFNPSYFSTLFKKETGQTFIEYLTALRMEKAKEKLRDTTQPISKICEAVGYADLKHFTAVFKKHTGIKPGEFRKLYS